MIILNHGGRQKTNYIEVMKIPVNNHFSRELFHEFFHTIRNWVERNRYNISFLKNMFSLFGAQNQKLTKICSK